MLRTFLTLILSIWLLACQTSSVDDVLGKSKEADRETQEAASLLWDPLDSEARSALKVARAEDASYAALMGAAKLLFATADLRVLATSLNWIETHPDASLKDILKADDRVSSHLREEVAALSLELVELCERALQRAQGDDEARLYRALGLGLRAWAIGAGAALLQGLGPKVAKSIRDASNTATEIEAAAGLRLYGRFLDRAPWPYGDGKKALELLHQACELAPAPLNWMYLGDALESDERREEARKAWRQAVEEETEVPVRTAAYHRRLCEARLRASN